MGEPMTPARLRIYASDLSDLDERNLAIAFRCARLELDRFPKVSQLRALAGENKKLNTQMDAEEAWRQVEQDLARRGRGAGPGLDDRTEYAIRCAGGRLLIDKAYKSDIADEVFCKKRFVEAFLNWTQKEDFEAAGKQLAAAMTKALPEAKR